MSKRIPPLILILAIIFIQTLSAEEKKPPPQPDQEVSATTLGAPAKAEAPKEGMAQAEEVPIVDAGNVTVNFKGADIRTVLAYLSEVSGMDIVPSPEVTGTVNLKLSNKPWKVALDIIVRNYGFAYEKDGDIIRVVTVERLKQEELATQAFNLNYGKAKEVMTSIKEMVSSRGKVMYDERTNIVLVTDIPTNIYNIGQIIDKLDKKTNQVLIEARIIETVLSDSEKLGIDWNIKFSVSGAKRPTTIPFEAFKTPFNTKSGEGQAVRHVIESWRCPEALTWETWLAEQEMYDQLSSLNGNRPPPQTVAEFIRQGSLYQPDINDGVRVNIAPLQKAGLLTADVLAGKDMDKAIADRAVWRDDERRWCREGKLPKPGWWE